MTGNWRAWGRLKMSESDTFAMLQTLDINGSGKKSGRALGRHMEGGEEALSEREIALNTMLLHSNQEASAMFLLQGVCHEGRT